MPMRWKQQEGNTSAIFSSIMTKANLAHMTPYVMKWKVSPAGRLLYLKNLLILNKTVKYPCINLDMDITQTAHPRLTIT